MKDLQAVKKILAEFSPQSISQRPQRGFSFANQSLVAVAHRLLRPVNAHRERDPPLFVNVADIDFKHVTRLIILSGLGLCFFYIFCMPSRTQRTNSSDALEYAMLLLLILIFTPLAFVYSFVWLLYPLVVVMNLVLSAPPGSPQRIRRWIWFWASIVLIAFTLPVPVLYPVQAVGNILLACLLLFVGLGCKVRAVARSRSSDKCSTA
jgi:hypothetical protein